MPPTNHIAIPLIDLKAQFQTIRKEVQQALEEVFATQRFILGPSVERFEKEVASYLGCAATVGVASGSDAILLSLMALGIGPGDAVITTPFTFFATASAIARLGATPIFTDTAADSFLLDPKKVEGLIERRFRPDSEGKGMREQQSQLRLKAILPVHLFGQAFPMESLLSLAKRYRLSILEDAAQGMGAQVSVSHGTPELAGTLGDLGCFSFFPSKSLGGMGDGGLVATDHKELGKRIRMLRTHGQDSKYHHQAIGINSRLDAIQAAILRVKLRYLNHWCEERIRRASRYHALFSESGLLGQEVLSIPLPENARSHIFNYYVIRAKRRNLLKQYLAEQGIQAEIYYPLPLHLQPCFAYLGYKAGDLPNSEKVAAEVLALPMYAELASEHQERVVDRIRRFYRK